jgi:Ca2+-binding EF-hand superfamily protein
MTALRAMDTNHNGMIDADEVSPQQKAFLERVLKKYGMDASLPISIDKIAAAQQSYYAARDAKAATPTPATPASTSSGSSAFASAASGSNPSVSGFGGSSSTAPASSRGGVSAFSSSGSSTSGNPAEAKYRRYAEMLLKQYDKNHNGVLDREEWSEMRGDWKSADLNGDGILTVDEITAHLMGYSQRRAQQSTTPAVASSASAPTVSAGASTTSASTTVTSGGSSTSSWRPAGDGRKAYRFLTPTERLQGKGLPDWFLQKNVDGQVTMSQFSSTWNDAVAAEFATYDRNNDGVITAEECLQAEKLKAQSAAAPQTHAVQTPAAH